MSKTSQFKRNRLPLVSSAGKWNNWRQANCYMPHSAGESNKSVQANYHLPHEQIFELSVTQAWSRHGKLYEDRAELLHNDKVTGWISHNEGNANKTADCQPNHTRWQLDRVTYTIQWHVCHRWSRLYNYAGGTGPVKSSKRLETGFRDVLIVSTIQSFV